MVRLPPVAVIRANFPLFPLPPYTFLNVLTLAHDLMEMEPIFKGIYLPPLHAAAAAIGFPVFDPEHKAVYRRSAHTVIAGPANCGLSARDAI